MASDLISRDAFKNYIDCGHLRSPTELCFSELDVVRMIDKQPTVDAVEVVRCKDCESRIQARGMVLYCSFNRIEVDDDDFCSYGARVKKDAVD